MKTRPTLYREEYVELGYKLCLLGKVDVEIADVLGVTERTITNWKTAHPEFAEALRRGKAMADAEIAASLHHRAKGYSHPDVHVSQYEGKITLTNIVRHYPPDTPAIALWLHNRQPDKWRNRQQIDHTVKIEDDREQLAIEIAGIFGILEAPAGAADDAGGGGAVVSGKAVRGRQARLEGPH